jgi:signal transduction histidine kinase
MAVALTSLGSTSPAAWAKVTELAAAQMLITSEREPPLSATGWRQVSLPDNSTISRAVAPASVDRWYRLGFEFSSGGLPTEAWALYLPYLAYGGQVWLNGSLAGEIPENSSAVHVRWARPHLVPLSGTLLRPGPNELMVRVASPADEPRTPMPRVSVGPESELRPIHDQRFFWVNTTPQITAALCFLVSAFVLFIWWRRRGEVLYGLFAVAVALWGIRSLTFVIEVVPMDLWLPWRLAYLGATGGFIVIMAMLSLRIAGIHKPWVESALALYWILGPLWLLAGGAAIETMVNRYWIAGFLPIGISIMAVSAWAVWRQRTWSSAVLPAAIVLGVLTGLHDYLVNWGSGGIAWQLFPGWAGQRIFLLHYGADVVLLAMGGLLTARFIQALGSLENLNQTLETRVADRERELAGNYVRMADLERQHAAAQERQIIMREIHDGLGSRLFVSLSRVERGDMAGEEIADALRGCIAEMRLALDALTPDDNDFRSTLGDFLFRWQGQLAAAGIRPAWTIDVPDDALCISQHAALQLLRIAQEALTNVLKHARATQVQVRLRHAGDTLELEVQDNGRGHLPQPGSPGRGTGNMRSRAQHLGGTLDVRSSGAGTCVALRVPMNAVLA